MLIYDVTEIPDPLPSAVFVTGLAGSGKTHLLTEYLKSHCRVVATTGAASVNLGEGVVTVNSALGYGRDEVLEPSRVKIQSCLKKVTQNYDALVLDEVSMLKPGHLQVIYEECVRIKMPLIVVGDFAQLPPVVKNKKWHDASEYAFDAPCWKEFRKNTVILPFPWDKGKGRQDKDPGFKAAVNYLRVGDGASALPLLLQSGVQFKPSPIANFPGTTLFASNAPKDAFNVAAYAQLRTQEYMWTTVNEGTPNYGGRDIPPFIKLRVGAKVMFTDNFYLGGWLQYANGDVGIVENICREFVTVRLTGRQGSRGDVVLEVQMFKIPTLVDGELVTFWDKELQGYRTYRKKIEIGSITFMPLELAYGISIHRAQGITFDTAQVCVSQEFGKNIRNPGMVYVAISRCRSGKGLILVGTPQDLIDNCNASGKVHQAGYLDLKQ